MELLLATHRFGNIGPQECMFTKWLAAGLFWYLYCHLANAFAVHISCHVCVVLLSHFRHCQQQCDVIVADILNSRLCLQHLADPTMCLFCQA